MYKNGHINDEFKKYLVPKLAKPGRLNGNPKLHKKKRPLRIIVNGIGTPIEKMAEVAEFQLKASAHSFKQFTAFKIIFLSLYAPI